jgi:hypothetical protein
MTSTFKIITCPEWGAVSPRNGFASIIWTDSPSKRIIFHHTAGHHREISRPANESYQEALFYARDIQRFHMAPKPRGREWNDSGHNFLVCRNGMIFQGRWRTVRAIQQQKMVVSAHCPTQNDQIGIEHEHDGHEEMTAVQKEASAWLQAWIASNYRKTKALPVDPHKKHFTTDCPANLVEDIEKIRGMAQQLLDLQRV